MSMMNYLEQLTKNKPIYIQKNNPDVLVKVFDLTNTTIDKVYDEVNLQTIGANIGVSPHVIKVFQEGNNVFVSMKRIKGETLADFFGEHNYNIPDWVWTEVQRIIKELFINGVQYIDISPYNFIMEDGTDKIHIIDYGHATEVNIDPFAKSFMSGLKMWNPDFR